MLSAPSWEFRIQPDFGKLERVDPARRLSDVPPARQQIVLLNRQDVEEVRGRSKASGEIHDQ